MNHYKQKNNIDGNPDKYSSWHIPVLKLINFRDKNVLDLGCGAGGFLKTIRKDYTSKVFGIEPNIGNIKKLEESGIDNYHGIASEFIEIESLKNNMDIVCSFEVLEHVYDYKDIFLPGFVFLKKGGVFCVSTPNAFNILRIINMFFGEHKDILMDPTIHNEAEHIRLYSYNMIQRAFIKSGFKDIKIYGVLKLLNKEIIFKNRFLINFLSQNLVGIGYK